MRNTFFQGRMPLIAYVALALVTSPVLAETHASLVKVAKASGGSPSLVKVALDSQGSGEVALTSEEKQFVDLINRERTTRGLNALTIDPMLVNVARGHSQEMSDLDYFDHHSPTPGIATPMDRYLRALRDARRSTPPYALVGENIYYSSVLNDRYSVAFGHQALMNSPGHRANILEPRFRKIGVGTYRDAKGQFWVTEDFVCDTNPGGE
jgi:uncharacterized protein YkwD